MLVNLKIKEDSESSLPVSRFGREIEIPPDTDVLRLVFAAFFH